MFFIGDCHGMFPTYKKMVKKMDHSLLLGDVGIGFRTSRGVTKFPVGIHPNHKFFDGNHDHAELCKEIPNYVGRYSYHDNGIFTISGGWSIDKIHRIPNIDWWKSEQLSEQEMKEAKELYIKSKPSIVCTHVPLKSVRLMLFGDHIDSTLDYTECFFDDLFRIHQPDYWIFGHCHIRKDLKYGYYHTQFIAVDMIGCPRHIDCVFELSGLTW